MVMTAYKAVEASFQHPTRWRQTLDSFGKDALLLLVDDVHFLSQMVAAAGESTKQPGDGMKAFVGVLNLEELFFWHGHSEERHDNGALNLWESHRQGMAQDRAAELFGQLTLMQQLEQLRVRASTVCPMPNYTAQLIQMASEKIEWPELVKPLVEVNQDYYTSCGDDESFQKVLNAWIALTALLLYPTGRMVSAA